MAEKAEQSWTQNAFGTGFSEAERSSAQFETGPKPILKKVFPANILPHRKKLGKHSIEIQF
jgi:hypothetical protein